jgi:hypothetical protein
MKNTIIIPLVCCCFGASSAWAIDCLSAPGDPKTGWYSWREIEGRRCWFKKTGAMPPKPQLRWVTTVEQEPRSLKPLPPSDERTEPIAVPPPQSDRKNRPEAESPPVPQFKTVRVKPSTAAPPYLGNDQVDLMSGATLSAMRPLAGARQRPPRLAPTDQFNARFTGNRDR